MPKQVIIQLTGHDLEKIDKLAAQRNTKNSKVTDRKIAKEKDGYRINALGLIGEFAVAKYLGYGVNANHNPNGGDGGKDFTYNNTKLDVKYSDNIKNPLLLFKNLHKFRADIAILTAPAAPNKYSKVKIIGWTDKVHFQKCSYLHDFGYGNTYCMKIEKLFSMELLKN